jgi:hypothetical protein
MSNEIKKTGMTPEAEEGIGGGEVQGVTELKTVIVKLRDGHGQEMVKIGLVVPEGDLYWLDERATNLRPAQAWVRRQVKRLLGG